MHCKTITSSDELWYKVRNYAESCSWRAGKALANAMDNNTFPNVPYTPYIGFMFVDEVYRGNRLSQQLICYAMEYLKSIGFDKVYLVSDHENLYEKYGFRVIDCKMAPWGSVEKIFMQEF